MVQANGITIEYELTGEGEPLLLVMGMLAKRPPKVGYLLSDMANDAAGLLEALGIASAHVVGMSMGGMIAQTLTIEHPQRVRSLTSIMSNPGDRKSGRIAPKIMPKIARMKPPTQAAAAQRSTEMFKLFSGPHDDAAEHILGSQASVDRSFRPKGTARQTAAIMASPDRTVGLRKIAVPTLIGHGLMDKLVLPSGGIATARAVPHSRLLMFPDMGHDLPASRLAEIIAAIRRNTDLVGVTHAT